MLTICISECLVKGGWLSFAAECGHHSLARCVTDAASRKAGTESQWIALDAVTGGHCHCKS